VVEDPSRGVRTREYLKAGAFERLGSRALAGIWNRGITVTLMWMDARD
jgi:hypothetical protein